MPDRTTIIMPRVLKDRAAARAREKGISFAEFVRRALAKELARSVTGAVKKKGKAPFWDNPKTFVDTGPADLSSRIDTLVYTGDD